MNSESPAYIPALFTCIGLAIIVMIAIARLRSRRDANLPAQYYCRNCGNYLKWVEVKKPGSNTVGLLLLLFFIIPGIIYDAWRSSSKTKICPICKSPFPIPVAAPLAGSPGALPR